MKLMDLLAYPRAFVSVSLLETTIASASQPNAMADDTGKDLSTGLLLVLESVFHATHCGWEDLYSCIILCLRIRAQFKVLSA
jgi:hypothetical protein